MAAQEDGYEPTTPMDSDHEEPEATDDAPMEGSGTAGPATTTTTGHTTCSALASPSSVPPGLSGHAEEPAPRPHEVPVPTSPMSLEQEPLEEPGVPASTTESDFLILLVQHQVFKPEKKEAFAEHRARIERQETLLLKLPEGYAPQRHEPADRATPYSQRPLAENEKVDFVLDVDFLPKTSLPAGWSFEHGFLQLGEVQDEWRIKGNHLIKYHYLARDKEFKPTADNCPVPLECLSRQRYTKLSNGQLVRDKWTRNQPCRVTFGPATAASSSTRAGERPPRTSSTARPMELNPFTCRRKRWRPSSRTMFGLLTKSPTSSLADFFEPSSISPRAKARYICQGYQDPDALNGSFATASPTLTRLSRGMILSITSLLGFYPFTSDISTAFLQGKKYDPKSDREIWIRLPKDADGLPGLPPGHGRVMKLTKPLYGLVDAPKAWFDEAVGRILTMGEGAIF
eukprot:s3002_g4.t1